MVKLFTDYCLVSVQVFSVIDKLMIDDFVL